jgi:hypothetical protein
MGNDKNKKSSKQRKHTSVLESLKDIGDNTTSSVKKDLLEGASQDILRQILGETQSQKVTGEIKPGESIEFNELLAGTHEKKQKERRKVSIEKQLLVEEKRRVERKKEQLKVQLYALQQEVVKLAESTQELGEETKVAAMQAPVEPGVYHLVFFEKLLEFIKSFRKKIQNASLWMQATNKRAEKKNFWAKYKKHGSKFLLSPDHYLTRSAG